MRFAILILASALRVLGQTPIEAEAAAAGLKHPDTSDPVQKQIVDMTAELDRIAGYSTPVWVCRDCQFQSDPKLGIIAGLNQVDEIRRTSKVTQFGQVLYWLLAHEFAHQVQFRVYGISLRGEQPADRQVYEAQADILAGKFLLERIPVNASAEENAAIVEALRVAYDLGTEQYSPADHPSHDARLNAVRLGMAAGMQAKLRQVQDAGAQASANVLAQKIDIRYGEDVLPWSLRTARRATNQHMPEILNLVLVKQDVMFDRDPSHPVAGYWLTYENRGADPLDVDLEVLCVAAQRDDREDNQRWQWTSTRDHKFRLPAGATYTASGALEWYGDNALLPRVISPPEPQALIYVERAGAGVAPATPKTASGGVGALSAAAPTTREMALNALIDLMAGISDGFLSLRAGPGLKLADVVDYPSRVNFPGALSTSVSIPEKGSEDDPWVSGVLLRTAKEVDAATAYARAVAQMREALPPPGPWKERVSGKAGEFDQSTYFESPKASFSVRRSGRGTAGGYTVSVSLRAED